MTQSSSHAFFFCSLIGLLAAACSGPTYAYIQGVGGTTATASSSSGGTENSNQTSTASEGGSEAGGTSTKNTSVASNGGSNKGGTSSKSGAPGSGGTSTKTSGVATGGVGAVASGSTKGGVSSAGSSAKTGGASNSGGSSSAEGGSGDGGASTEPKVCAWEDGPSATNGALTCYWFAQGTSKDEKTCPGGYKTYCGYCGSETGEKPQGDGQNWCPINDIVSTVKNISTTHFVAIPPTPLGQGKNCGACVEVTYMGRSIVATVIDACPSCLTDQHIDLNLSAAKALGMTEMMGEVKSGVQWRIVGCPTTSNITVGFNGGYQGQVYFQNAAFPIARATSGGREASVNTGFWDFGKEMGGQEVTLTDVMGHTVTATVPAKGGDLGVQFAQTCE